MSITKRERTYLIVIGSLVGVWLLYYAIVSPFLDSRAQTIAQLKTARDELAMDQQILDRQRKHLAQWQSIQAAGVNFTPSTAESQVEHAVGNWAQDSGVTINSLALKDIKNVSLLPGQDDTFKEITYSATAAGNMASISRLLWHVETAKIPVRIDSVQINPRQEATDDLLVQLNISALCLNPEPIKSKVIAAPAEDQ